MLLLSQCCLATISLRLTFLTTFQAWLTSLLPASIDRYGGLCLDHRKTFGGPAFVVVGMFNTWLVRCFSCSFNLLAVSACVRLGSFLELFTTVPTLGMSYIAFDFSKS